MIRRFMQIRRSTLIAFAVFAAYVAFAYGIGGFRAAAATLLGYIIGYYVAFWTEVIVNRLRRRGGAA